MQPSLKKSENLYIPLLILHVYTSHFTVEEHEKEQKRQD